MRIPSAATSPRRPSGTVAVLAGLTAFAAAGSNVALADPVTHKVHRSVPATAAHSAPDTTGAIPAKVKPPLAPLDDETLPPPFTLPKASRARMRACGHQWESMKDAGETGDDVWRDFAMKCLTARADPVVKGEGALGPSLPPR